MTDNQGDMYATKKDLESTKQELLAKLASKEELKKLATKEELKKLATKEELKQLATKEDIKKFVTKAEFNKSHSLLRADITKLQIGYIQILERMETLETKENADRRFNLLMQAIDGLAAKFDSDKIERAASAHTFMRHESKLENHEKRITKLEAANKRAN